MTKTHTMSPGVVGALEADEKSLAQPYYPLLRWRWAILIFTISCISVGLVFAFSALGTAWHTGQDSDWSNFWNVGLDVLRFSPLLVFTRKDVWKSLDEAPEHVRIARQAARSADDSAAPLAETQPEPLDTSNPGSNDTRELVLRRPHGTSRDTLGVCGWLLIVGGIFPLTIGAIMLEVSFFSSRGSDARAITVILALSGSALVGSGWLLIRMRKTIAVVAVRVDYLGIAWRPRTRLSRWRRISWDQALAFITLSYRSMSTYQSRHLYALDTAAGVLSWEERDLPTWETHTDADRAEHEDASYLRRLIVTCTGLPMRDISSALDPVKTVQPAKPALKLPLGPPGSLRHVPVDQLIAEPAPPAPAQPPRIIRAERFALASLGVFTLLLYGGGWGLQQYQQRSYSQLPTQVHQEQPLYSDALAFADGDWPQQKSSTDYPTSAQFVDRTYHVSGIKNEFAEVSGSGVYGDAAIEVTVRQLGNLSDDHAGLAIRVDDGVYEMMTFTVSATDGTWWFSHYRYVDGTSEDDWTVPQPAESSPAIHRGEGAANTLLVVVRGGQYLCYINGHFVGIINDSSIRPPRGHVGLYVDDGAATGIFTNLAIYPVPPPRFPF